MGKNMKDKTAVITGATSGLGRATALQLAQKGASVVIIARSITKANELLEEIEREGGKAQSVISDLSSMEDTKGGEYIHHRKIKKSWPPTRDEDAQIRLYDVTQGMLSEWLSLKSESSDIDNYREMLERNSTK